MMILYSERANRSMLWEDATRAIVWEDATRAIVWEDATRAIVWEDATRAIGEWLSLREEAAVLINVVLDLPYRPVDISEVSKFDC